MGLFSRKTQPEPGPDVLLRLARMEHRIRELETDWDLTYEKFQRLSARLAKRARDEEERAQSPQEQRTDGRPTITNPLAIELLKGRS